MMSGVVDVLSGLVKRYWFAVALAAIVLIALMYRLGVIGSYVIPTYGNTMYHVGIEREMVVSGHYPEFELSYGGGFKNFYVPAYRLLIASMCVATGIDPMVMSGLMTIVIAVFVLLVMFSLAYRMSDNLYVALFAAFFFIISPEITIYTMRALPELLGLFLVPFTLYFVVRKNRAMTVVGAVLTALTHQMTLAALAAILGLYAVFLFVSAGWAYVKKERAGEKLKEALWCLAPVLAACLAYGAWQTYSLGTPSIMGVAQVINHEGNVVDLPLFLRAGVFVLPFFAIGLGFMLSRSHSPKDKKEPGENVYGYRITADTVLLVVAWLIATLILTFNNWINPLILFVNSYTGGIVAIPTIALLPIFMDRFFTFFVQAAIIVAGFGMYALLRAIDLDILKVKP